MDIIKEKKMPEKPLKNFNFYRNVGNSVTVDQIVRDYNEEYPDKLITAEDVKFGPLFREHSLPEPVYGPAPVPPVHARRGINGAPMRLHFVYMWGDNYNTSTERDMSPQGVFVFEEEPKPQNLAEVFEIIEHEKYLDRFTIRLNSINDYESFHISDSKLVGIIQSLAKANNWQFRRADRSNVHTYSELYGYLTVDDNTYQLMESPRGLTLFDKPGEKIKSGEGENVGGIMGEIGEPVHDELKRQEREWLIECCGGEYPDPDP